MYPVELYLKVRQHCLIDGNSERQTAKDFGISRNSVRKMLIHSKPPGYQRTASISQPILDPHKDFIDETLESDKKVHRKQRHTAKRLYDRLTSEKGYTGSYVIVRKYVAAYRLKTKEMFIPLEHEPGTAQVDFGEAFAIIAGVHQKVNVFNMSLPQSDVCFVKAYPRENTESFCDGHVSSFAFIGGIPSDILYDNTKIAVAKIMGNKERKKTKSFTELQSHYLFKDHFARPGKGNDKGKVEGVVGFARRNFMVPVPSFDSFDDLNVHLKKCCEERQEDILRGHKTSIKERFALDQEALSPLPERPYDPCVVSSGRVSSTSLVRYKDTDYSVPVRYGYQDVFVKAYVDKVLIIKGSEVIATHKRSYEKGDAVYDFLHYLPLLEQKANALDQAAPLKATSLPPIFDRFKTTLMVRDSTTANREYIKILRLLEIHGIDDVEKGLYLAFDQGIFSVEAIKHLILNSLEKRSPNLSLKDFPNVPVVCVQKTNMSSYMGLMGGQL